MSKKRRKTGKRPYQDNQFKQQAQAELTDKNIIVCQVCRQSLAWLDAPEGPIFSHPGGHEYDHRPVPTVAPPAEAKHICDFCSQPDVVAAFVTMDGIAVFAPAQRTTVNYGNQWYACGICADLVARRNLPELLKRAVSFMVSETEATRAVRLALRRELKRLYLALFQAKPHGPFPLGAQ